MLTEIEDDDMKNVKEGARFIGVSSVTLHRIMKRGEIGFFKIGSRIVFSREKHLVPFLLKNEIEPSSRGKGVSNCIEDSDNSVDETMMPLISVPKFPDVTIEAAVQPTN